MIDADAPAADCERYTRQRQRLTQGVAAFEPPRAMTVGKSEDLILSVGRQEDTEQVHDAVGGERARHVEMRLEIGHNMTATLTGQGFKIEPEGAQAKELTRERFETWHWKVTPLEEGKRKLQLRVSADATDAEGKRTSLELATRTFDIDVDVSLEQSLDRGTSLLDGIKGLLLALAAVLGAVGAVWAAARTNLFGLRKPAAPPAPTESAPPSS